MDVDDLNITSILLDENLGLTMLADTLCVRQPFP